MVDNKCERFGLKKARSRMPATADQLTGTFVVSTGTFELCKGAATMSLTYAEVETLARVLSELRDRRGIRSVSF